MASTKLQDTAADAKALTDIAEDDDMMADVLRVRCTVCDVNDHCRGAHRVELYCIYCE